MADLAQMQADRHHLGRGLSLAQQHVEGVAMKGLVVAGAREGAVGEFSVIVDEAVGHDEVRPPVDLDPIGKLVVIGVAVVEKAALLDEEAAGVDARPVAAIPADRALAEQTLESRDRLGDLDALLLLQQLEMPHPAIAVAADVAAGVADRRDGGGIALEGQRAAEHGQGQAALAKQPQHPPEADAAAIFEHALGSEIALPRPRSGGRALRQAALADAVAIADGGFRSFLVVHDEVDSETRPPRPARIGRASAIAHEIPLDLVVHARSFTIAGRRIVAASSSATNFSSSGPSSFQLMTTKRAGSSRATMP